MSKLELKKTKLYNISRNKENLIVKLDQLT